MLQRFAAIVTPVVFCLAFMSSTARALLIDYDASVAPNAIAPDRFSFIVFSGTNYSVSGGQLTLTTAPVRGIWFGNGNNIGADPVGWSIPNDSVGHYLRLTIKLSANATDWSAYLNDGSYATSSITTPPTSSDRCPSI